MPSQNDQNKENENKNFTPWRIVAVRNWGGAIHADPTHSSELRWASWLTFSAAFGAG